MTNFVPAPATIDWDQLVFNAFYVELPPGAPAREITAKDWAVPFLHLGKAIRESGMLSMVRNTTISGPMDPLAIRVLWLAGMASDPNNPKHYVQLIDCLTGMKDGADHEREQFRSAIKTLMTLLVSNLSDD